ncbi:MAG: cytochrome c biogenesis protein CcsA [Armatimonadota bacterium]
MKFLLGIWMAVVIVAAFLLSPPLHGLGEAGRIVYFHVPCAWAGTVLFLIAAFCGVAYIRTQNMDWDCKSSAAAQVGLLFTVLATASGAVWAQAAWGKWWNWDPRQVFIFIVVLVYGAYFALRMSIDQIDKRALISSVYSILALVAAVFLTFIAIRLPGTESLHPQDAHKGMDKDVRMVFLGSLVGFTGMSLWMWRLQTGVERVSLRRLSEVDTTPYSIADTTRLRGETLE